MTKPASIRLLLAHRGATLRISLSPAAQCTAAGGDYQGDGASCATAACPQPPCAYELTLAVGGEGTVSASPSRDTYDCDSSVRLTATPAECWHFVRWEGDLTGTTNPASLTMNEDHSITAVFEADRYTLVVTVEGEGSVSLDPAGGTYDCGIAVRLTVTAEPGWHFVRWADDASGTDAGNSVVMSQDRNVTAVFEQDASEPPEEPSENMADTSGNDEQGDATPADQPAQGACGGVCPATSGGMIGLMLAGLLRGRATIRRVKTR